MTKTKPLKHQMIHQKLNIRLNTLNLIPLKKTIFYTLTFLSTLLIFAACHNRNSDKNGNLYAPFLLTQSKSIDSLLEVMTLDEKLGQLVFIETMMLEGEALSSLSDLVKAKKISGLLATHRGIYDSNEYFKSVQKLQNYSTIPLLIGLAPNNHFENLLPSYELSSVIEDSIKHQIIERNQSFYSKSNYSIAFDVDLRTITQQDTSLQNSFFVEQQIDVLANSNFIINNYQSNGILTGINSCVDFQMNMKPTDYYSKNTYLPYQNIAKSGASLIYLNSETFTLDTLKSLKQNAVREFLADSLDFGGLSFAHAGDEKHVAEQFRTGIDAFIVKEKEVEIVLKTLKATFEKELVTQKELDKSVKKILMAKDWASQFEMPIQDTTFYNLQKLEDLDFKQSVAEHSITIIKDDNNLLPFNEKAKQKILLIKSAPFISKDHFPEMETYELSTSGASLKLKIDENQLKLGSLDKYDLVILALDMDYRIQYYPNLNILEDKKNVVLLYSGDLSYLNGLNNFKTIIHASRRYKNHALLSVFGKYKALGQTYMNVSRNIKYGQSEPSKQQTQLRNRYILGGQEWSPLQHIDTIVQEGITKKAMPGCQVMVIKNGEIYFEKAYGNHTYSRRTKVKLDDIYDLASITKVMSTTMAMMKLYEAGKYKLTDPLHKILDLEKNATIRNITIKELLIHESGLQPNMPINRYFKRNGYYTSKRQDNATIKVSDGFYLYDKWLDTLWHEIQILEIGDKGYRYSDINANILQRIVEKLSGKSLDDYVNTAFYEPLLMAHTLYQPLNKYKKKTIVPTEKDGFWRKRLVHGYVHDESASLLGGVAGNAGLFSNVSDMAIFSQMLLNGGTYNSARYLKKETIDFFTASTHGNHRGLGFNKQRIEGSAGCASVAPMTTYGHTGFTGNCLWIDPESKLIYIFLSNRVYPKRNSRLSKLQIREQIHQAVYDGIIGN